MKNVFTKKASRSLDDVSLEIRRGEILGIAGVDGNGQDTLIDSVTGLTKITFGSVKIKDKDVTNVSARTILEQ